MKIAMIGHKRIPGREGGIEIVVNELATRMAARGEEVHVYNRNCGEQKLTEYRGVRIHEVRTFKNPSLNAMLYSLFATLRAVTKGYDVIHFHAEGPCAMLPLARLFCRRTVATIHGLDWNRAKWGGFATRYLLFGEKMAARFADELIVLSQNMQQYFLKEYGRKTRLIPNGIEAAPPEAPKLITEKYGLIRHSYLLFVARITPEKGLHYLIDAFKSVATDKKLVIAGRTEPETEYIKKIKQSAAEDPRIILTGFVQGQILSELFSNCFLYILPSDLEGMPISLLEAVGARARCLVSDIPENTEPAADYVHTFAKGDSCGLAEKLTGLLEREDLYGQNFRPEMTVEAVENQLDEIIARYSWETITDNTLALYRGEAKDR